MKKTELQTFTSQVTVDVLCNKCGKSCQYSQPGRMKGTSDTVEYVECHGVWGYWSDGLDGERHDFDLCQVCYQEFAKTFVIPPSVKKHDKYQ